MIQEPLAVTSDQELDAKIRAAGLGDRSALNLVCQNLYDELHAVAAAQMAKERPGGLLQTTAIVHEAYFRLAGQNQSQWKDRQSFLAVAAVVMRRLLVDSVRKESAQKRGGRGGSVPLAESQLALDDRRYAALEIHDALDRLAQIAPQQARALELLVFGGMTIEQIALHLDVSPSTIDRTLRSAKAWLRRDLS